MKAKVIFILRLLLRLRTSYVFFLSPGYDDLVPNNHPVRIVNTIVGQIDISASEKSNKGGGTFSHHLRILLQVIIYAYLRFRKIEQEHSFYLAQWPK